jgi:hypothetical protein
MLKILNQFLKFLNIIILTKRNKYVLLLKNELYSLRTPYLMSARFKFFV